MNKLNASSCFFDNKMNRFIHYMIIKRGNVIPWKTVRWRLRSKGAYRCPKLFSATIFRAEVQTTI